MVEIRLNGVPEPQMRPRFSKVGGCVYDPQSKEKKRMKARLEAWLMSAYNTEKASFSLSKALFSGQMSVELEFYLPIAISDSRPLRSEKQWGLKAHVSKPDVDNLAKFILDCGKGVLWEDDSQIVSLSASKYYSDEPRTLMRIEACKMKDIPFYVRSVFRVFSPDDYQELLNDMEELVKVVPKTVEEIQKSGDGELFTAAAFLLNRFAVRHHSKLHKIKRFEGIPLDAVNEILVRRPRAI